MRFIHAADIHLDSPLCGLDAYEGAPVHAIRGATRKAFANLVQLALAEQVDLVVLAGDLYDGDWPDYNTGLFFVNQVRELASAGIPVVLLTGNHDAESRITARLTLPPNVHVLPTDRPGTKLFDHIRVAVHGQGYARQAETRNLAADYPAPISGYFNIGVLHTALDGREGHLPYAPCRLAELSAKYDYWALGHVHQRESVNGDDHPRIEYPGNLQGRHVRETGAKGCLLVDVDANGRAVPDFRALDVFRWQLVTVDATSVGSMADVLGAAAEAVTIARDDADGRSLAVRVVITCGEEMYQQVATDLEHFRFDLAGQAGGSVWVEKVKLVRAEAERMTEPAVTEDAASELRAVLAELRGDPDSANAVFATSDCGKLRNVLPAEVRGVFETNLDDIMERATTLLTAGRAEGES